MAVSAGAEASPRLSDSSSSIKARARGRSPACFRRQGQPLFGSNRQSGRWNRDFSSTSLSSTAQAVSAAGPLHITVDHAASGASRGGRVPRPEPKRRHFVFLRPAADHAPSTPCRSICRRHAGARTRQRASPSKSAANRHSPAARPPAGGLKYRRYAGSCRDAEIDQVVPPAGKTLQSDFPGHFRVRRARDAGEEPLGVGKAGDLRNVAVKFASIAT